MTEYEQLNDEIKDLQRRVAELRHHSDTASAKMHDLLVSNGYRLGLWLLALLYLWVVAHYTIEYLRISASGSPLRVADVRPAPLSTVAPSASTAPPATEPSGRSIDPMQDAKRTLEDHLERTTGNSANGNTYQFSLDGMREVIKSLENTKQIALGTAQDLLGAFADVALETGGEITKDAAKALIDRYLAPQPDVKTAAIPLPHQVQVNVYTNEKRIVTNPPNKAAAPRPKPKSPCPPLPTQALPGACPAAPAQQTAFAQPAG